MDMGLSRPRFVWILAMEFMDEVLHVDGVKTKLSLLLPTLLVARRGYE